MRYEVYKSPPSGSKKRRVVLESERMLRRTALLVRAITDHPVFTQPIDARVEATLDVLVWKAFTYA